jgi:hypothetical protein
MTCIDMLVTVLYGTFFLFAAVSFATLVLSHFHTFTSCAVFLFTISRATRRDSIFTSIPLSRSTFVISLRYRY